jgi:hypothetical protein
VIKATFYLSFIEDISELTDVQIITLLNEKVNVIFYNIGYLTFEGLVVGLSYKNYVQLKSTRYYSSYFAGSLIKYLKLNNLAATHGIPVKFVIDNEEE